MGLFGKPSAEKIEQIYQKGHAAHQVKDNYLAGFNLRKAGELGHVPAMMEYAWMHYNGELNGQAYAAALTWFEKAAEHGDPEGMYLCGLMYCKGIGTQADHKKALPWLEKAAEMGDSRAMLAAAVILTRGEGVPVDLVRAFRWMKAAAESSNAGDMAILNLANMYAWGMGTAKDDTLAFHWYCMGAERGIPEARIKAAAALRTGTGTDKDVKKAIEWYERAAEQGEPEAMYALAGLYLAGENVDDSVEYCLKSAKHWFRAAADKGYEDAEKMADEAENLRLGLHPGVYSARKEYPACLKRMAENGNKDACFRMGMYQSRMLRDEDALTYLLRGAGLGDVRCMYQCGTRYMNGQGTEKDRAKAVHWLRRAAESGFGPANDDLKSLGEKV